MIDDGSDVPIPNLPADVHVIRNPHSIGVSQARRYGAAIATGDILVWLDAHMTFAPDWLDHMLMYVESGALLCSAFWDYELSTCYCWGADFVWCSQRNYAAQCCPGFGLQHRTRFPGYGAMDVPMVIGACYMMQRESYEKLGGFSPLFCVWGVDEQDMSARAWLTGFGVKCVTSTRVGHLWRPSFPYPVQFEHLEFNQLAMVRTVFEEETVQALKEFFEPIPAQVRKWLEECDVSGWRQIVQSNRRIGDEEFFHRFVPLHNPAR